MSSSPMSIAAQAPLLHAFCHRCERWRVVDADAFTVDFSKASDPPPARCPDCGEFGLVKMRVPARTRPEASLPLHDHAAPDPRYLV